MNDFELIRRLQNRGLHDEAAEVVKLLEERDKNTPRMRALEFELDYLAGQLRDATAVEVVEWQTEADATEDAREPVALRRIDADLRADRPIEKPNLWAAMTVHPRTRTLMSLRKGDELPSERGIREGRAS